MTEDLRVPSLSRAVSVMAGSAIYLMLAIWGWNGVGAATYLGKAGQGVTGLFYGDSKQFAVQLIGAALMAVWAFGLTYLVFKAVNAVKSLRVSPESEREGLDLPEFGMHAYPEDALSSVK